MAERSAFGNGRARATRPGKDDGEQACKQHGDAGHGGPGTGPAEDAGPAGGDGADEGAGPNGSEHPTDQVENSGDGYGEEAAVLAAAFGPPPAAGSSGCTAAVAHDGKPSAEEEQNEADDTDGRHRAALAALRSAVETNSVMIYDPADLASLIRELQDRGEPDPDFLGPIDEAPDTSRDLSSEDRNRLHQLRRIACARLGPRRRLLVGTPAMLARVEAVAADCPHFAAFLGLVSRAVALSLATGTPLRLPPTLLVGEPGIGKTYVLKRIAAALATDAVFLPVNILDTWKLRGLNPSWKGARMGKVAEALLASPTASPVIVLDEFEKAPALGSHDRPYDVFHSLLEEENAQAFVDDFLELPLHAEHVLWIASANATAGLPASIVDRLLVLQVPAPTRDQLARIVDRIYATVRGCYGDLFAERVSEDVRDHFARHNPRRLKRIIALALGFAVATGRHALLVDDVRRAIELAGAGSSERGFHRSVGFIP